MWLIIFLRDEATLAELVGSLATDVVKIGIAVGAGLLMAAAFGGAALAIGPLVIVIFTGIVTTFGLDMLDNHYGDY